MIRIPREQINAAAEALLIAHGHARDANGLRIIAPMRGGINGAWDVRPPPECEHFTQTDLRAAPEAVLLALTFMTGSPVVPDDVHFIHPPKVEEGP